MVVFDHADNATSSNSVNVYIVLKNLFLEVIERIVHLLTYCTDI